jgi:NAD(P)-dependent dehydrogenase (short-subunit alcohol dehydrogenase family)
MKDFAGRVAVITGAGSGIGRALALALARRGARLALSDIDAAGVAATAASCLAAGTKAEHHTLDVADRAALDAYAAQVVDSHGRVDLVVNNAGVSMTGPILALELEEIEWIMGINFWGVVYGTKAFLPHMVNARSGHIVIISSIFGVVAVPGQAAYNASKFAVRGFTEALRQEMRNARTGVAVSCVHPGGVRTDIARGGRFAAGVDAQATVEVFDRIARTTPEIAAATILRGVEKDKARIFIGPDAFAIDGMQRVLGSGYQAIVRRMASRSAVRSR